MDIENKEAMTLYYRHAVANMGHAPLVAWEDIDKAEQEKWHFIAKNYDMIYDVVWDSLDYHGMRSLSKSSAYAMFQCRMKALPDGVNYLIDLVRCTREQALNTKGIGPSTLKFIEEQMESRGLYFGMKFPKSMEDLIDAGEV